MPNPYINRVDIRRGNTTETLINIGDTTAVASDVASGKYFYLATGEKVVGTSSGGGTGGVTQDQDGYLVLDDQGGGGGGGGSTGLVYESGTYEPTADVVSPTISFANTHASRPFHVYIIDTGSDVPANSMAFWEINSYYDITGAAMTFDGATMNHYARTQHVRFNGSSVTNGGSNISALSTLSDSLTESQFVPTVNSTSGLYRSGRTYKWLAVWAPTS